MQTSAAAEMTRPTTRERRRRDLAARIERHAVDLALSLGSSGVTVEAICERSDISVRSFYNYFDSKDAAIVGEGPTMPTPAVLERFRTGNGSDILADLLDAVSESFTGLDGQSELQRDRARLMRAEPYLLESMGAQMVRVRDDLIDLVRERLGRQAPELDDGDLTARAVMIVELKSAVMKSALHLWAQHVGESFDEARRAAHVLASRALMP